MTARLVAGLVTLAVLWSPAAPVRADDEAEARALFERGVAALVDGRFPEARDLLRDSLELGARPSTAFNLVLALLGTEEPVEAGVVCDRLLSGAYGELTSRHRAEAERECARAEAEVATLVVSVTGGEGAQVRVDGTPRRAVAGPEGELTVRLDPGAHLVSANVDGRSVEERVVLTRGQTSRLDLRLPPVLLDGGAESDAPGVPWLWVGIGGAAVVTALVVGVLVVSAGGDGSGEPIEDPVFGVTTALH